MRRFIRLSIYSLVLLQASATFSQQIKFNRVLEGAPNGWFAINNIVQDQQGYLWFKTYDNGFSQYDGSTLKSFTHDLTNKNSVSDNGTSYLAIDKFDIIWIGTYSSGLNRFDPATKTFTHFRHDPKNISSLASDTIASILVDHLGNIWIGAPAGLDRLDPKTGTFLHYTLDEKNTSSLRHSVVFTIYEDRQGTIWAGCVYFGGIAIKGTGLEKSERGGLYRFDRVTEKFTRHKHNPADSNSLTDNNVTAIFEDSKGNFWVGTGDGLHTMDRTTGKFTHYPYDPSHPEKLSRPPLATGPLAIWNMVNLITEDRTGAIWIGGQLEGINRYDPVLKKVTHYGHILQLDKYVKKDTVSGFNEPINNSALSYVTTNDGLLWIGTNDGNLYNIDLSSSNIPYYNINTDGNSFLAEGDSLVWVATSTGLLKRNKKTGIDKKILHNPDNPGTLSNNNITTLRMDASGNLWLGTWGGGINKFDPKKNIFIRYKHDTAENNSLSGDSVSCLHIDQEQNIWLGVNNKGLDKIDLKSGRVSHYRHDDKNPGSLINSNYFSSISEDKKSNIWIGTHDGLDMLDQRTNRFYHYLVNSQIISVCADASGDVWAGSHIGFYRFDRNKNNFTEYADLNSPERIAGVSHILEDDERNLWLSTANNIIKINAKRNSVYIYGKSYGVHTNTFYLSDNYKAKNGEIFIGDQNGYYSFFPDQLQEVPPPHLIIAQFKLNDQEINPGDGSVIKEAIWATQKIKLSYTQNVFSFDFKAIDYRHPGEIKYLFMLENYDNNWHNLGADHKAYFFDVPPGEYVFRVRAINSEGGQDEKKIAIIILPPWWKTWWAYASYILIFSVVVVGFIKWRVNKIKKEKTLLEEKLEMQNALMNERTRISRELHDEVGATLSGIAMYSHLAKDQIKNVNTTEVEKSLNIMQQSAGEMVNKLNDIVWLINPDQDSLQKLIQRLEEYARDMAAIKNMHVKVNVPSHLAEHSLPIECRRNIYLFCKEAINNAVKYSNGTLLELNIKESDNKLEFSVSDNGKGFDAVMVRRGNGLENMQKRADEINAKLTIQSKQNEGALVSMQVKIT